MSVLPSIEEKASYVEHMFSRIASNYDRANRVMTFGMDQSWRQKVVDLVAPPFNGRALDIGAGTGDFLPLLAEWIPRGVVVGADFCLPMMQAGQPKIDAIANGAVAAFVQGDALQLPFSDDCFDAITTGFMMRNVIDIPATFRELWRVARPGGVIACLEVARPRYALLRLGHRVYFEGLTPWIGALVGSDRQAYAYLPQSARAFPSPPELAQIMQESGWCHVYYTLQSMGAVAIHIGVKLM